MEPMKCAYCWGELEHADDEHDILDCGKVLRATVRQLRAENGRLDAALADTAAQLTDAVQRAREAEHAYGLLVKQADASHAENAQLREQLRKAHITTIARVYNGEPLDCEGDGSGPGCEHAALWEIQAMDSSGSHYSYVCANHLDDYQKWAADDGRMPLVFETD